MGYLVLIISIIGMLFVVKKDENTIGVWGGTLCAVQLVFMILPIISTEKALKKTLISMEIKYCNYQYTSIRLKA